MTNDFEEVELEEAVEEEWDDDVLNHWDSDDDDDDDNSETGRETCCVCFEIDEVMSTPCCQGPICANCFTTYLHTKVSEGVAVIQCPITDCQRVLKEYEVLSNLASYDLKQKFHKFFIDAQNDPTLKTCPRCGQERKVEMEGLGSRKEKKYGHPVTCHACALTWCFSCHAPWHEKVTCEEYVRGDRAFRRWAQARYKDRINAQRCPCCQTYIQRSQGCNSMTCARCGSNFCYQCGLKFSAHGRGYRFPLLLYMGEHGWRWSPLGCPGLLLPASPRRRQLLKGLVFGAKIVGTLILPPLLLVLAAVLLVLGLAAAAVLVPAWAGVKAYRKLRPFLVKLGILSDNRRPYLVWSKTHSLRVLLSVIGYRRVFLICLVVSGLVVFVCGLVYLAGWVLWSLLYFFVNFMF